MKTLGTLLFLFFILSSSVFAQTDSGYFSYQAVVRDQDNELVKNKTIGMQISIIQNSPNGNTVYVEQHNPTTNANGLLTVEVGNGAVQSGNFAAIPWADGPFFIETEIDFQGGSNYDLNTVSQLLSVPYALHARTAESAEIADSVKGVSLTQPKPQSMSVSEEGDTLFLERGNWVIVPGISAANQQNGNDDDDDGNGLDTTSVVDIDGNVYGAVKIGGKYWTTENLKTTRYANGDAISNITTPNIWLGLSSGAWRYYNDNAANNDIYGKLYNWYAVHDNRGLCPTGWAVPTDQEWSDMLDSLGTTQTAGVLKQTGTTLWDAPNTGAIDSFGFSALPGGFTNNQGGFGPLGERGAWWATNQNNRAFGYRMDHNDARVFRVEFFKHNGFSIRCIKED